MAQPTLTEVQNGNNNHLYFELDGLLVTSLLGCLAGLVGHYACAYANNNNN